ncbi:PREDICTED: uncharacterized protein LOC104586613 [Nelumbo nucifera]|uniref:Uncharacterized protein LOC104586613 n=1 Tax=Nelumbo nucifera TaxID=4432 RepID=A0A1U7YQ71_NELNU|nr:PREDICTED: uncharacterized protein LOC104586613 [Nelumbo nucifera]
MSDGPKLYTSKPKKAQLKQHKGNQFSTPSTMETPPPPQPPKESFARRYKFVWPLLLTVNLAVGAYLFMRTKKKDTGAEDVEAVVNVPSAPVASTTTSTPEIPPPAPSIIEPLKVRQPIPEDQQRELFKWILEEKRKVKPKNPGDKKSIDEEKAILKQFIRAKSIPTI